MYSSQCNYLWVRIVSAVTASAPLRLVNGYPDNACSGRVEIYHQDQWGTVCHHNWGLSHARVVCRQLGCGRALSAPTRSSFSEGSGPIWMDGVGCSGWESSLMDCRHQGFGPHNCTHHEDAGVVCEGECGWVNVEGPMSSTKGVVRNI